MADSLLHELEPALLDDNTEVKVPFSSVNECNNTNICHSTQHPIFQDADISISSLQPGQDHQPQRSFNVIPSNSCDVALDTTSLDEVNQLLKTYRRLPADMFINQILHDYCTDEGELERLRALLFESLKVNDDFPYGLNCTLKRRVRTRHGERLAVKIAKDIHALLSTIEGADYLELKDLINTYNHKGRSKSVCSQISTMNEQHRQCNCSCELKLLSDKISNIEADMLLTKQRQVAVEVNRSEEIQTLKKCVAESSGTLQTLSSELQSHLVKLTDCLRVVTSHIEYEISGKIKETKSQIISLSGTVLAMQSVVTHLYENIKSNSSRGEPPRNEPSTGLEENTTSVSPTNPVTCLSNECKESVCDPGKILSPDDREQEDTFGNVAIPVISNPSREPRSKSKPVSPLETPKTKSAKRTSYRDALLKENNTEQNMQKMSFSRSNNGEQSKNSNSANLYHSKHTVENSNRIPVRIARNQSPLRSEECDYDFDLTAHVKRRKKTKRFYVGGFLPSISETELKNYVSERGQKVSKVTVFRNKKYNTATIRLNVFDNGDLYSLENPFYWPRGITCRPWVTYSQYKRSRAGPDSYQNEEDYDYQIPHDTNNDKQCDYYNRFSALSSDVD